MSNEEVNLDEADLPVLRKKYLTKVIICPLVFVLCVVWMIFAIIYYVSDMVSDAWFILIVFSLVIAPIAGVCFLSLTLKNSGLLRKVVHKQKGIEPKDREKYYYQPDPETIILFEKRDKHGTIYFYITTAITVLFLIFYLVAYINADWVPRLVNFIDEAEEPIIGDIFSILGFISLILVIVFIYAIFEYFQSKRQQKREKKSNKNRLVSYEA